jgi:ankyrin repeat protein
MFMKQIRYGIVFAAMLSNVLAADLTFTGNPDARVAGLAMKGDRAGVAALLKQQVDVNEAQGDGMTALHWAAMHDDAELARLLIAAGASLKATTRVEALTPLALAARQGHASALGALLKAGANPNLPDDLGTTPLMLAAASGSVDSVKALLDAGADVNARDKSRGQTALMFAAGFDRIAVIPVLAAAHADLNAASAVAKVERRMVDEDGNPLPAERAGQTAQRPTRGAVAEFMGGWTALHFAARDGFADAVQALLASGANVNRPGDGDHTSALVIAIENGHFDLAKYLVEHGADASQANDAGMSPVYAVLDCQWAPVAWAPVPETGKEKTSYLELLSVLAAHKADFNVPLKTGIWYRPADHNQGWIGLAGSTPFWRAAQANDLAAMKFAVAHGADPKAVSAQKDTALQVSAGLGWAGNFSTTAPGPILPTVKYLVEEIGVDVNAQDALGYTAIMGAAYRGLNDVVEYLASKGAKLDYRTSRGWSVTDMANGPALRTSVPLSHPDTVALLTKLGAPPLLQVEGEEILGVIKGKAPALKREEDASTPPDSTQPHQDTKPQ